MIVKEAAVKIKARLLALQRFVRLYTRYTAPYQPERVVKCLDEPAARPRIRSRYANSDHTRPYLNELL